MVVGIRPEHFEDAALLEHRRGGRTVTVGVEVLESVGSDVFVHFTAKDGRGSGPEDGPTDGHENGPGAGREVVARIGTATRAAEGRPLELWVDTARLHVFDPGTGAALTSTAR